MSSYFSHFRMQRPQSHPAAICLVILLSGFFFFLFLSCLTPTPSVTPHTSSSSSSSSSRPVAWNGYNPLIRTSEDGDKKKPFLSRFFSWLNFPFRYHRSEPKTPSLPKTFLTETVAGVHIAHHNPFPPHRLAGVALLFHACRQSATDWFTLPEHRRLAAELLRHRLALLAITSSNRVTGCWSTRHPAAQNHDAARVRLTVRQWLSTQRVSHAAPIYAVGISSGATFLSVIAAAQIVPSLVAQALYLSAGNPRALRNATERFPNTLFVRLQSDHYYASSSTVATARATLLARRVPLVAEMPLPLEKWTPLSLHKHEPRVSPQASAAIFEKLATCRLDIECAATYAASQNTSAADVWKQAHLQKSLIQVARVLRGGHELSAEHANQVADWLIQHSRQPSDSTPRKNRRGRHERKK